MSIILRQNKGSELTFNEVDGNFTSLFYSSSLAGNVVNFFYTGSNPPISQSIDLSNMPGIGGVQVYDEGTQINYAQSFYFTGEGVAVSALPSGGVLVDVSIGSHQVHQVHQALEVHQVHLGLLVPQVLQDQQVQVVQVKVVLQV